MTGHPEPRQRLSVVIPVLDEAELIGGCLDAVREQADPVDEIVVVDNGSTDGTLEIARATPGVTVIEEPRRGISYARNAGFEAAHGDLLRRSAWHRIRDLVTTGDDHISEDVDIALALHHTNQRVEYEPGMLVTIAVERTLDPAKLRRYRRADKLTMAKYEELRDAESRGRPSADVRR
jgi:glycosyltransferase involved in cell wall biosynthesis